MPLLLPPALERSLDLLRCPACRTRPLRRDRAALRRPTGHTYGIARCGCASLLTGRRATSGATRPWPGPGTTSWPRAATYPSARWWPGWRPPPCPIGVPWDRWRRRGPRPGSPSSAATSPNDPCLSPGTTPRQQEGGRARTHDGMVRARDPMSSDSANTAGRHPGSSTVFPIVPLASIARCAAAAALSGKR